MKLGVIGGTGVYDIDGIEDLTHEEVQTPFGIPSDSYVCGKLDGREVVFLPRHGRGHRLLPSEINHRANICGMKQLGVDRVLSISAVGSLREEYRPRDIVLADQYFDRTKESAAHTFFGDGVVAHAPLADPVCHDLAYSVRSAAEKVIALRPEDDHVRVTHGGTYVQMQGPAFSTRAESNTYRGLGFDVIGMTSLGEAKLCREAELCYQPMCMVTDYDCWHETEEAVTVELVIAHLHANAVLAKDIVRQLIPELAESPPCRCSSAMAGSILTQPDAVPADAKARLQPIIGGYLS
jgi:5'-methylthioadenosine phosphorylase